MGAGVELIHGPGDAGAVPHLQLDATEVAAVPDALAGGDQLRMKQMKVREEHFMSVLQSLGIEIEDMEKELVAAKTEGLSLRAANEALERRNLELEEQANKAPLALSADESYEVDITVAIAAGDVVEFEIPGTEVISVATIITPPEPTIPQKSVTNSSVDIPPDVAEAEEQAIRRTVNLTPGGMVAHDVGDTLDFGNEIVFDLRDDQASDSVQIYDASNRPVPLLLATAIERDLQSDIQHLIDINAASEPPTASHPSTDSQPPAASQSPNASHPPPASQPPATSQRPIASHSPTASESIAASQLPIASHSPASQPPAASQLPIASHSPTASEPNAVSHLPIASESIAASQSPNASEPNAASQPNTIDLEADGDHPDVESGSVAAAPSGDRPQQQTSADSDTVSHHAGPISGAQRTAAAPGASAVVMGIHAKPNDEGFRIIFRDRADAVVVDADVQSKTPDGLYVVKAPVGVAVRIRDGFGINFAAKCRRPGGVELALHPLRSFVIGSSKLDFTRSTPIKRTVVGLSGPGPEADERAPEITMHWRALPVRPPPQTRFFQQKGRLIDRPVLPPLRPGRLGHGKPEQSVFSARTPESEFAAEPAMAQVMRSPRIFQRPG
jgi:hypothetical protein